MRLFKYPAALALLLLVAVAPAFADIALPNPNKNPDRVGEVRTDLPFSRMTIERVDGLREARLQIPRSQLSRMSAAAGLEEPPARSKAREPSRLRARVYRVLRPRKI